MEYIDMTHYEFEIDIDAPLEYVFEWGNEPRQSGSLYAVTD